MTTAKTLLILFIAALLEAGGDALVRKGLHSLTWTRGGFLLGGTALLLAYGCTVNTPPWDFGRLLGVYIAFFFVIAQIASWLAFGQVPGTRLVVGGIFIIGGGLIISLA